MRYRLALAASALVALTPAISSAAIKGDVNLDGKVDSADYALLNQALAGTVTLTWEQRDAADVAPLGTDDQIGDGVVDSADALIFDQALQGLDIDGDGLDPASEIGGTPATNGSPFLRDTDRDGMPDNVDPHRGSFDANAAPVAPTAAVTSSTTTTLGGTVTTCTDADSLPYPSQCTLQIRIVAAGDSCNGQQVVAPISPSGGTWSASGLASGVLYTVYAVSSDGALTTCSSGQTMATAPTGNAAVVPRLLPLTSPTNSNPVYVSGYGAPGEQVRIFVNGVEQDFVRTFATGNPAISPNPFVVPASGAFSVPVVLDDNVNFITATGLSPGGAESDVSNQVSTKYENVIPRNTVTYPGAPNHPLRILQQPVPDDPNSEEIVPGRILVLTKGDMPGFTTEYYLDHHLEVKANALLVIGSGAALRFAGPTPFKTKIIVAGTMRTRGTATTRVQTYAFTPTYTLRDQWGGVEVQSTSTGTTLAGLSVRNVTTGVKVFGASGAPDITVKDSYFDVYTATGIDVTSAGQVTVSGTELHGFINGGASQCLSIGISVVSSATVSATDNIAVGMQYGVQVVNTTADLERNDLDSSSCLQGNPGWTHGAGIYVKGSLPATVSWNRVALNNTGMNSGVTWYTGILVENASPLISNNDIRNTINGIEVFTSSGGSSNPVIEHNLVDVFAVVSGVGDDPNANKMEGATVIRDGAGATIRFNHFANELASGGYGRGVFVLNAGSAPIEVASNELTHLLVGVHIENAAIPAGENISIHDNSIGFTQYAGILARFTNAVIQNNSIATRTGTSPPITPSAIDLYSTTATVQGNSLYNSAYGLRAFGGTPQIIGNSVNGNSFVGIRLEGTAAGTLVEGNRIDGNLKASAFSASLGAGILVASSAAGTFATIDAGNIISGNTIGVRIEGLANSATGQPVPVITGNAIYQNGNPPATGAPHNIEIVSYSTPTQTTLDVTSNWWNSTNQTTITQGIVYVNPPSSGLQPIANIDFLHVVTAPNTNFFVGQLSATIGSSAASAVFFTPNLSASPQPVAAIKFFVYDAGASVVVRICKEQAASCAAATALYSTSTQTLPVGAATVNWNGADGTGKLVAPEAYQYVVEATKQSVTQTLGSNLAGAFINGQLLSNPAPTTTFDGYGNSRFMVKYQNSASQTGTPQPGPLRVVFEVRPKDALGRFSPEDLFITGPEGYPDGEPIPDAPLPITLPYVIWNSRNPVTGHIVSGDVVVLVIPKPMRPNVVIVSGSAPALTSGAGSLNLTAEPRLVFDTFEQVAAISYKVDRLSDVTVSLLPPDSWDDTNAPTWTFTNVPANTAQLFEYRGYEVAGMNGISTDSARNLLTALVQQGAFTFRVRATDKVSLNTAETTVTVQVRH